MQFWIGEIGRLREELKERRAKAEADLRLVVAAMLAKEAAAGLDVGAALRADCRQRADRAAECLGEAFGFVDGALDALADVVTGIRDTRAGGSSLGQLLRELRALPTPAGAPGEADNPSAWVEAVARQKARAVETAVAAFAQTRGDAGESPEVGALLDELGAEAVAQMVSAFGELAELVRRRNQLLADVRDVRRDGATVGGVFDEVTRLGGAGADCGEGSGTAARMNPPSAVGGLWDGDDDDG